MAAIAGVTDIVTFFRNMPDAQVEDHIKDVRAAKARVLELEDFIRFLGECKSADEVYDFVVNHYDKMNIPGAEDEDEGEDANDN